MNDLHTQPRARQHIFSQGVLQPNHVHPLSPMPSQPTMHSSQPDLQKQYCFLGFFCKSFLAASNVANVFLTTFSRLSRFAWSSATCFSSRRRTFSNLSYAPSHRGVEMSKQTYKQACKYLFYTVRALANLKVGLARLAGRGAPFFCLSLTKATDHPGGLEALAVMTPHIAIREKECVFFRL